MTGQTFLHAMTQYRKTRDPKEPLFLFQRCLAHFAVDTEEVHFTTKLSGRNKVSSFNQGNDGGKGNPPRAGAGHFISLGGGFRERALPI